MDSNSHKNNPDFKSSDDAFEYLINQRLDEKRKKEWAKELGEGPEETSEGKKINSKKIYLRVASIAAIIIVIFGFFLFTQKNKPLDQYAGNLLQETEIRVDYGSETRGYNTGDREIISLKSELTSVLLDQDFNQALGYFRQLEKVSALTVEDKYYYAVSLLKSKGEDNQKAIRFLNDVIKEDDDKLENALWLRALAYGKTDNSPLMKKDLTRLNSISKKMDDRAIDLLSKY